MWNIFVTRCVRAWYKVTGTVPAPLPGPGGYCI
jgi:hypothetical protein